MTLMSRVDHVCQLCLTYTSLATAIFVHFGSAITGRAYIAVRVLDAAVGAPGCTGGALHSLGRQAAALSGRLLGIQLRLQLQRIGFVAHLHCSAAQPALNIQPCLRSQHKRLMAHLHCSCSTARNASLHACTTCYVSRQDRAVEWPQPLLMLPNFTTYSQASQTSCTRGPVD